MGLGVWGGGGGIAGVWVVLFFSQSFILSHLGNRTKPISIPYDGRRWWDSNLRIPAGKSPALPLCYGRRFYAL